jgi:hypothetical protein
MVVSGTTNGGSYALLWMLILIVAFQIGSRKLRKKLHKPGEEMPKAVQAMRHYVRRWTASVFFYLLFIVMFIMNAGTFSADPRKWSHWVSTCTGAQCETTESVYQTFFWHLRDRCEIIPALTSFAHLPPSSSGRSHLPRSRPALHQQHHLHPCDAREEAQKVQGDR